MKIKEVGFGVQKIGQKVNKPHGREKGDFSHSFGFNKLRSWATEGKTSSKTMIFILNRTLYKNYMLEVPKTTMETPPQQWHSFVYLAEDMPVG